MNACLNVSRLAIPQHQVHYIFFKVIQRKPIFSLFNTMKLKKEKMRFSLNNFPLQFHGIDLKNKSFLVIYNIYQNLPGFFKTKISVTQHLFLSMRQG